MGGGWRLFTDIEAEQAMEKIWQRKRVGVVIVAARQARTVQIRAMDVCQVRRAGRTVESEPRYSRTMAFPNGGSSKTHDDRAPTIYIA